MPDAKRMKSMSYEHLVKADSYIWDGSLIYEMSSIFEGVVEDALARSKRPAEEFIALIPASESQQAIYEFARAVVPLADEEYFVHPNQLRLRLISSPEHLAIQKNTFRPFTIHAWEVFPRIFFSRAMSTHVLNLCFGSKALLLKQSKLQAEICEGYAIRPAELHITIAFDFDPNDVWLPFWDKDITFDKYLHSRSALQGIKD